MRREDSMTLLGHSCEEMQRILPLKQVQLEAPLPQFIAHSRYLAAT